MHFTSALALLASTAFAFPTVTSEEANIAARAAPKNPCPSGWDHFRPNFDDLLLDKGGVTHGIHEGSPDANHYNSLYWNNNEWQVVSPGDQTITNGFGNHFNMTAHSAKGALVSCQESARLSTYYGGELFSLRGFWVRHQTAKAFNLQITCYVYQDPSHSNGKYSTISIPVAEQVPYGSYKSVQLSAAQRKKLGYAYDCTFKMADGEDNGYSFLVDDMEYCFSDDF